MLAKTHVNFSILLIIALIIEGMVAKSSIFVSNDPTTLHYATSAFIGILIVLFTFHYKLFTFFLSYQSFIFVICFIWAFVSTWEIGFSPNYIALFTFALMYVIFFYAIPAILFHFNFSTINALYVPFIFMILISVTLAAIEAPGAVDPDSGRFWGAFISVANAGLAFTFFAVFSAFKLIEAQSMPWKWWHGILLVLTLYLLFLTKTRSALAETFAIIAILVYGFRLKAHPSARGWLGPTLAALSLISSALVLGSGSFDFQNTATDFRLAEGSLEDSRARNWEFGIERIVNAPLFGEGLLTKQTQGGSRSLDIATGDNYDPTYDPHSLILSFGVQAGIPFALGMMALILGTLVQYLMAFGLRRALSSPEFVICLVHTFVMIPGGGDLTSFGNVMDRIYWIFLGFLAVASRDKFNLVVKFDRPVEFNRRWQQPRLYSN
jgi:O-antigen ligase